ncbi:TPA: hypothetical protein ACX3LH_002071 [Klebsiella michiganensis]
MGSSLLTDTPPIFPATLTTNRPLRTCQASDVVVTTSTSGIPGTM